MTDTGEQPEEISEADLERLDLGKTVYDEGGDPLGEIRGFDSAGFYVMMLEGYEALSTLVPGRTLGETELMWRCTECGEMGCIADSVPDSYPTAVSHASRL